VIGTFQALLVALIALLPGAAYTFCYERQAGAYGIQLADRLVRFVVSSALFHAVFSGAEFLLWKHGRLDSVAGVRELSAWQVQGAALGYILIPAAVGTIIGLGSKNDWRWTRAIVGTSRHPRAWDYVWSRKKRLIVRLRLTSGEYLAGLYARSATDQSAYASGYGEDADLYLYEQFVVDPASS
jgi:hypothetical protein